MRTGALLAIGLAAIGCGGAQGGAPPDAPDEVEHADSLEPAAVARRVKVDVRATRVGAALRLDIAASGRTPHEGAAFEDPERWSISARQAAAPLTRLVNGSVEVERDPIGSRSWDTVVRWSVVYQIAGDADVRVRLTPPEGPAVERVFSP